MCPTTWTATSRPTGTTLPTIPRSKQSVIWALATRNAPAGWCITTRSNVTFERVVIHHPAGAFLVARAHITDCFDRGIVGSVVPVGREVAVQVVGHMRLS